MAEAQVGYDKMVARKADLTKEVDYLSTEQGVEAELRTKYRAVKEGESVAVIVDNSPGQTAAVSEASSSVPANGGSWWTRLLHAVGL